MTRRRIFPWFDARVPQAQVSSPCASRSLDRTTNASRVTALPQVGDVARAEKAKAS